MAVSIPEHISILTCVILAQNYEIKYQGVMNYKAVRSELIALALLDSIRNLE